MSGDAERTAPPTPRRLKRAREQGDVVRSTLAPVAAALLLAPLPLTAAGRFARWFAAAMHDSVTWAPVAAKSPASDHALGSLPVLMIGEPCLVVALAWLAAAAAAIAAASVSGALSWTPAAVRPNLNRTVGSRGLHALAPKAENLVAAALGLAAVLGVAACAWPLAREQAEAAATRLAGTMAGIIPGGLSTMWFRASGVLCGLAAVEIAASRKRRLARLKMTPQEVRDERNEHEGRPEVKARRRGIALRRSRRLRLGAVRTATAVVANPTHVAVALRYAPPSIDVPVVVCSGAGDAAARIRTAAGEYRVPVIESPELARRLFVQVEVDDPIPEDLYAAVAAIFAFILRVRGELPGGFE